MKLTINTSIMQGLVAKAMKGALCSDNSPMTGLMAIELKDNTLTLTTTDLLNHLFVKEHKVVGDDFYVVVQAEIFAKLISKLTSETVTMELNDQNLVIKGNGKYLLELPLDEEGELFKYPDPLKNFVKGQPTDIKLSTIKLINTTAKPSLATDKDEPMYIHYYMGNKVIATDTCQMCGINVGIFEQPAIVNASLINLLEVMSCENIKVYRDGQFTLFETEDCVIYSGGVYTLDEFNYPYEVINGLLNEEFDHFCKLSKKDLLQLLDRLVLFVSPIDDNGIYLTFTKEGLIVTSLKDNSSEIIQYAESNNFKEFSCSVDIRMFTTLIKANSGDFINLQYGRDNAIKMVDGNVTQVLALIEETD